VQTKSESTTVFERGWILRYRMPRHTPPSKVALFLHGWTGDENSMEIFARGLPENVLQIFPRGPVSAPGGGYGWTELRGYSSAKLDDYASAATRLIQEIEQRLSEWHLNGQPFSVTGFSQGAAVAYTIALLFPAKVNRIAALAGFMPGLPASIDLAGLGSMPVYIAHGVRDETIPVEEARKAASLLHNAGADVEYCENHGGHKLPTNCFAQLTQFLNS